MILSGLSTNFCCGVEESKSCEIAIFQDLLLDLSLKAVRGFGGHAQVELHADPVTFDSLFATL